MNDESGEYQGTSSQSANKGSPALDRQTNRIDDLAQKNGDNHRDGETQASGDRSKDTTNPGIAEQGPHGEQSHGGNEGEALYGYGRHGGSVADTGTRTDVPVGIEQIESSKAYKVSPKEAGERQGDPRPLTSGDERGVAGSTKDDIADQ